MKTYEAKGVVFGNYWGGGKGAYPARPIQGESKEDVIKQAEEMLEDGSLDSGMGYESLIGALLVITETETKKIDGKMFTHKEQEDMFIGDLTEEDQDFLYDCLAW